MKRITSIATAVGAAVFLWGFARYSELLTTLGMALMAGSFIARIVHRKMQRKR